MCSDLSDNDVAALVEVTAAAAAGVNWKLKFYSRWNSFVNIIYKINLFSRIRKEVPLSLSHL